MSNQRQAPISVFDGFMHRPFDPDRDGWRMEMVDAEDFPAIRLAEQILDMRDEINELRKANWRLRKDVEMLNRCTEFPIRIEVPYYAWEPTESNHHRLEA